MLVDGPETAPVTLLLAHGAGGAMDSPTMTAIADALAAAGLRVVRFEFEYMTARRAGRRKPPPLAEKLIPEFRNALAEAPVHSPLIIGGKSMGGRVASMLAEDLYRTGEIAGLLCLGYPFHPVGKPDRLRTAHLEHLRTPTLICQGTRDSFGSREEVAGYALSYAIEILWLEDGDHDLKPRKRVSGFSAAEHLRTLASATRAWSDRITTAPDACI